MEEDKLQRLRGKVIRPSRGSKSGINARQIEVSAVHTRSDDFASGNVAFHTAAPVTIHGHEAAEHPPQLSHPRFSSKLPISQTLLQEVFGFEDNAALGEFLSIDWVVDTYSPLLHEWLRPLRINDQAMPRLHKVDDAFELERFRTIIDRALSHIRGSSHHRQFKYAAINYEDYEWDDTSHAIRFIVQLVENGRASARLWSTRTTAKEDRPLLVMAYRLWQWLSELWSRKFEIETQPWVAELDKLCALRAGSGGHKEITSSLRTIPKLSLKRSCPHQPPEDSSIAEDTANSMPLSKRRMTTSSSALSIPISGRERTSSFSPAAQHLQVMSAAGVPTPNSTSLQENPRCLAQHPDCKPSKTHDADHCWKLHPHLRGGSYRRRSSTTQGHGGSQLEGNQNYLEDVCIICDKIGHTEASCVVHLDDNTHSDLDEGLKRYRSMPNYPNQTEQRLNGHLETQHIIMLLNETQIEFEKVQTSLLATYGVGLEHRGSCVLINSAWLNSNPIELLGRLTVESCGRDHTLVEESERSSYIGHGNMNRFRLNTTLRVGERHIQRSHGRLAAFLDPRWAGQRRPCDLEAFSGTGRWPEMHGSHTCHHGLCIIHLVWETMVENMDRKACAAEAQTYRKMRISGELVKIPQYCTRHTKEPCLLQNAALTTFEAMHIQTNVLRSVRGESPLKPMPAQLVGHQHPTFEVTWPASFADPHEAIEASRNQPQAPLNLRIGVTLPSPPLRAHVSRCFFCRTGPLVEYTFSRYVTHIRKNHQDANKSLVHKEIKRAAIAHKGSMSGSQFKAQNKKSRDGGKLIQNVLAGKHIC